jgi:hypothetical protein
LIEWNEPSNPQWQPWELHMMKLIVITFAAASLLGSVNAHAVNTLIKCWNCTYNGAVESCAPVATNIAETDRVLAELAQGELKDAETFKATVAKISALDQDKKMVAYLQLAGVQLDEEIAQFIGARDHAIDTKYIDSLSRNADLTRAQSAKVLEKISVALLGPRK